MITKMKTLSHTLWTVAIFCLIATILTTSTLLWWIGIGAALVGFMLGMISHTYEMLYGEE